MSDSEKSSGSVLSSESSESESSSLIPGCTNPHAANYDPTAEDDDGSCMTCVSEGLCIMSPAGDGCKGTDCGTLSNGCCDDGCLPCELDGSPTGNDCSPSFASSFTAANGTYYPSCYG